MNATESRLRNAFAVRLDRGAVMLAALFAVVIVPSVYLAVRYPINIEPNTYGLEGATLGGAWVVAEVVLAAALVGLIFVFRYLPEWVKKWIYLSLVLTVAMVAGAVGAVIEMLWPLIGIVVVAAFVIEFLLGYDLWWIGNNVFVLIIAIMAASVGAAVLGVEALVVGMIGLSVYDWYFADRKPWMMALAAVAVKYYAPVLFIFPNGWRLDWEDLVKKTDDDDGEGEPEEDDPSVIMGIGTADLMIPAMFAAAVAIEPSPLAVGGVSAAALGVGIGTLAACLRLRWKILEHESGAGLPPLTTGALVGYAPFALGAWVVALV